MIFKGFQKGLYYLVVILTLLLTSCNNGASGQYNYQMPESINDGITVGSLLEVNLDTTHIYKLLTRIKRDKIEEVHSVLIYKNGHLVLEEYFKGHDYVWENDNFWGANKEWTSKDLHNIMSDTKSVTSALIGIAIEKGFIKSVEESVFNYLPEYLEYKRDGREHITIEHLLTMTCGLEGNEWVSSYRELDNPIISVYLCEDPIECILDRPVIAKPGTYFSYWGGNQILLGEIIKNASNMELHTFAKKYLFEPLRIEQSEWAYVNKGPQDAAGGLELTPRAMAKIGITFLNDGQWHGEQIIPKYWVGKSATPYRGNRDIRVPGQKSWRHGYTYGWWTKSWENEKVKTYFAEGWGGQNIFIMPEQDMVVVFTGGNYTSMPPPKKLMDKYIITALK